MFQIILNSLISGIILGSLAYAFSLVFSVLKVFHLAQASIISAGGLVFSWVFIQYGFGLAICSIIILAILLSYAMEILVYLPLFKSRVSQMISLISSIGINLIIINILSLSFGNQIFKADLLDLHVFNFNQYSLTNIQLFQGAICLLLVYGILLFFKLTNTSLIIKGTSDKEDLIGLFGINIKKVRLKVMIAASLIASLIGIVFTIDIGIDAYSGVFITLSSIVVAILSGKPSLNQILIIAILISILQGTTEWFLSSQWKEGVTFLAFLVVLLLRTEGIVGYSLRQDK